VQVEATRHQAMFCPVLCPSYLWFHGRLVFCAFSFTYSTIHGVSWKRHPFSFFHNSVNWWSIYTKFLPHVAEEMLIKIIWTKDGC